MLAAPAACPLPTVWVVPVAVCLLPATVALPVGGTSAPVIGFTRAETETDRSVDRDFPAFGWVSRPEFSHRVSRVIIPYNQIKYWSTTGSGRSARYLKYATGWATIKLKLNDVTI